MSIKCEFWQSILAIDVKRLFYLEAEMKFAYSLIVKLSKMK